MVTAGAMPGATSLVKRTPSNQRCCLDQTFDFVRLPDTMKLYEYENTRRKNTSNNLVPLRKGIDTET